MSKSNLIEFYSDWEDHKKGSWIASIELISLNSSMKLLFLLPYPSFTLGTFKGANINEFDKFL